MKASTTRWTIRSTVSAKICADNSRQCPGSHPYCHTDQAHVKRDSCAVCNSLLKISLPSWSVPRRNRSPPSSSSVFTPGDSNFILKI